MIDLYALLSGIIEPICPCFVQHYPTTLKKVYPYVEINETISPNNQFSDVYITQIDIWDNKDTDITEIESISDAIHAALNYYNTVNSTIGISINRNTPYKLSLPDPIIGIQRKQLKYLVKVYKII